jgi:hypothetical protein
VNRSNYIVLGCFVLLISFSACTEEIKPVEAPVKERVFPGFHPLLDELVRTKDGVFRGLELNVNASKIKSIEGAEPTEVSDGHLYYEYQVDSVTNYSIDYAMHNDSLDEINVQINTADMDLSSYLFCDLKDYYANKLPNPTEDKGQVVYNCFEGQRKPFVVSLSDNSTPATGIISMLIYKDK